MAGVLLALVLGCGCNQSPEKREAAFLKRGLALEARRDYTRAILEFRNAGQAMPTDAEPEYQLGMAYLAIGHFGEARSEERRVGKECQSVCRSRWSPYH